MKQQIAQISLLVKDYDEAIAFYTKKLHFVLVEDTVLTHAKRWVIVLPPGNVNGCKLLLAKAANEEQINHVGNQTGGRVFLFLCTDNFERDYNNLLQNNISIIRQPTQETYGMVAVFADLYGNLWDLIEPVN
jgi:catechol 2,3-dioxygenase-like lactoylglutathione lyase family enzyme